MEVVFLQIAAFAMLGTLAINAKYPCVMDYLPTARLSVTTEMERAQDTATANAIKIILARNAKSPFASMCQPIMLQCATTTTARALETIPAFAM